MFAAIITFAVMYVAFVALFSWLFSLFAWLFAYRGQYNARGALYAAVFLFAHHVVKRFVLILALPLVPLMSMSKNLSAWYKAQKPKFGDYVPAAPASAIKLEQNND